MLRFLATGRWREGQVRAASRESSRQIDPVVESRIERAWAVASNDPTLHLFDGPMCRLERFSVATDLLRLELSPTSYRIFFGTNMRSNSAQIDARFRANPLGASAALISGDGFLMFGHRSASVAYYPDRVHPFAGTVEPRDGGNVFAAVRRELHEELSLDAASIESIVCLGLVEDIALCQPELIFIATSRLQREQIGRQLDPVEHGQSWSIPADAASIDRALGDTCALTPVAVATLLLVGRELAGEEWFESRSGRFTSPPPSF